jgi:hypothetical protein
MFHGKLSSLAIARNHSLPTAARVDTNIHVLTEIALEVDAGHSEGKTWSKSILCGFSQ